MEKLNVVDGIVMMQRSALYANYCAVLDNHHICPESWFVKAGKTVASPMIFLSPSDHMNVHAAIDSILYNRDVSRLPLRAVALARQAFDIAANNGLSPAPTL